MYVVLDPLLSLTIVMLGILSGIDSMSNHKVNQQILPCEMKKSSFEQQ